MVSLTFNTFKDEVLHSISMLTKLCSSFSYEIPYNTISIINIFSTKQITENLDFTTLLPNQNFFQISFPLGEGFGFNFNIFETNLLNLSVVIGVVVSFGGKALRSLLDNRKQNILNNLEEADKKAQEAQEKLDQTKTKLEEARKKASEIYKQGNIQADQDKKNYILETQNEILRLEKAKDQNIQFQQQQTINEISKKVLVLALKKVRETLNNKVNANFHSLVNNLNIVLFTKSTL